MKKNVLTWKVYVGDFNSRHIEEHNVFDHGRFWEDCCKNRKKNAVRGREDKEAFVDQLRRDLMFWYWSKCEWEVVVSHWPPSERHVAEKVDVYDQVRLNWDRFVDYVWENRMLLKPEAADG